MKKMIVAGLVIAAFSIVISYTSAEKNPQDKFQFINNEVTVDTNLHFTGKYCDECHEKQPGEGKNVNLRFNGNISYLCRCHEYTPSTYTHPVDMEPSEEKKAKMSDAFPLQHGKITCLTCHDIYKQCQKDTNITKTDAAERRFHRDEIRFLRGGRSQKRTDICFNCHEEQQYRNLNPHKQLTEKGAIIPEICLYCHTEKPDEKTADFDNVTLIGDLKALCQRCHGKKERHPAGINHYLRPSDKLYTRMQMLESKYETVLPLDSEYMITCITCHNPHERGVMHSERPGAKGAGKPYRHRIPKVLCESCHGM